MRKYYWSILRISSSIGTVANVSVFNSPSDSVTVTDNRTGQTITIPVQHNSIPATAFKVLKVPYNPNDRSQREEDDMASGLRIYDPAFMNTAALSSKITYIDGDKGTLMHRGYPIGWC